MTAPPNHALFLDFDGTLVEIVDRPDAVAVGAGVPQTLERLSQALGGALAIVSGRPIAFLDGKLAPFHGDAAGLHGVERRLAGVLHPCRPEEHPALRRGIAELHEALDPIENVIIEDKGCSVAVHWRMAPAEEARAKGLLEDLAARLGAEYRIQHGKMVAEILPALSGKGRIIAHFMESAPYAGRRPVFIGDDLTDENGFETVNRLGGVAVRIGDGDTCASHRLPDVPALYATLERWANAGGVDLEGLPEA
ncbi:trehalose-phosphatase [Salinarimonas ramus]|uniref:Trehalose 6-phosphate phosphatase n=1 Tax=Salinarimonas ramus TaxID=690164 RepID=A0A917V312_9HYPH|nr:trehalose-phosphatase [Salinarimonas ramus]GGK28195.1 putative trehalose-phosphate phosphatase [Salinarimonas ramus]